MINIFTGWRSLIFSALKLSAIPPVVRTVLYRLLGMDVSLGSRIHANVHFRTADFSLGSGSTVNLGCVFDNRGGVKIGKRCGIGIDVLFITSDHDYSDPECRAGVGSLSPIRVGDGVWLGSRVTVLSGVTIGSGAVVASGAVVTKDVPDHCLVGGIPAKVIRTLPPGATA